MEVLPEENGGSSLLAVSFSDRTGLSASRSHRGRHFFCELPVNFTGMTWGKEGFRLLQLLCQLTWGGFVHSLHPLLRTLTIPQASREVPAGSLSRKGADSQVLRSWMTAAGSRGHGLAHPAEQLLGSSQLVTQTLASDFLPGLISQNRPPSFACCSCLAERRNSESPKA